MNPDSTSSTLEIQPVDPRDRLNYPLHQTRLHRFAVQLLSAFFRLVMVMEIEGRDNIPPAGGAIIAANHLANFDIFPLQMAIPRPLFYMGKAELFKNPMIHFVFRNLGAFPVYRGERDEWAILHARRVLEAGQLLGMFPEGTRSHGGGLKVAKTGAARLAISTHLPIVPVALNGTQDFFRAFPRRTRVTIKIGAPILPEPGEMPLSLTDRVMFQLAQGLTPELRGVYARMPEGMEK